MSRILVDKRYASLEEALIGISIPEDVRQTLRLIQLPYVSFNGRTREGQMVVHCRLDAEITQIFEEIHRLRFPIQRMIPVRHYDWDDDVSMAENNSSCFNYRMMGNGRKLSYHSFGIAVDINPFQNPCYLGDGEVQPPGANYHPVTKGALWHGHDVVDLFRDRGWEWGGDWRTLKDLHHFEKIDMRPAQ